MRRPLKAIWKVYESPQEPWRAFKWFLEEYHDDGSNQEENQNDNDNLSIGESSHDNSTNNDNDDWWNNIVISYVENN